MTIGGSPTWFDTGTSTEPILAELLEHRQLHMTEEVVLPSPCLIVLVGPSGAGKSTWAATHFRDDQIVSSDRLRAVVADDEDDLSASDDAFALLDQIVAQRAKRRLTTVVDTLGLDPARRQAWLALARRHDLSSACVVFVTTAAESRRRNQCRGKAVPDQVLAGQVRQLRKQRGALDAEGFDTLLAPSVVRTVPQHMARTTTHLARQEEHPLGLGFGLQVPVYSWTGGPAEIRNRLQTIASSAETAGFSSIWLMDHFRQIPMFGPAWRDMLESYTTLAFLAACTERVRLATLVTGIAYRNVAHLGKIVATLDVLSGGRAMCGLGLGWFEAEHRAYGWTFPSVDERYALLEDALQLLPLMWGKGAPRFEGQLLRVPEALCYPRPLQEHVPILVGGNGERRTLRLAAKYADACNIIGEIDAVERKVAVLRAHCHTVGRDPSEVEVTQLSTTLLGDTPAQVAALVEDLRPRRTNAERYATAVNAGTVNDQIGRFRALADKGVGTAIVSLPDLDSTEAVERFGQVIAAFS